LSDQTSDKPVELTPARRRRWRRCGCSPAALDHCRDAKGQAMDPARSGCEAAILAALTATASTTGQPVAKCRSRRYVKKLGASLAKRSGARHPRVDVQRLRRPRPGARMEHRRPAAVSTGALQQARTEAELAAMIAHALAHAASRRRWRTTAVFEEKLCLARGWTRPRRVA